MNLNTLKLLNSLSILVAEDDKIARIAISQGIKPYCENYYEAKDGLEGLELFKKHQIDIVITDIHMPSLNGFEMIKEILKLKPHQIFIIMTSFDTDRNIQQSIEEGACSFLRKPLDMKELQTVLLINSKKVQSSQKKLTNDIEIDYKLETIYLDKKAIFLSNRCNKIFWLLCYNLNNLVSYEMIEDWAYDGEPIKTSTLHTAIQRIKQQLKSLEIINITGQGYILKAQ